MQTLAFDEFQYLHLKLRDRFPQVATRRPFPRGAYLYDPSTVMHSLYIIKVGVVKVGSYSPEGEEIIYDLIYPSDFCGNLGYLGGGFFSEFARALTDVELVAYDLSFFKEVFREDTAIHDWFVKVMVKRWARTERRLFRIASMKPEERLRSLIEELDSVINLSSPGKLRALDLLSKKDLAHLAGMTRQTAAKILRSFG